MKILILCESSGIVREAFRALGHDAWSCDLLPADDGSPFHIQADMREAMAGYANYDLIGAHLPCTYVCGSGIHWNDRGRGWEKTEKALNDVRWLMSHDVPWYLENPVGIISSRIRKPNQTIQPYEFGENASKRTCLWLNKLPNLRAGRRVAGRVVEWPGGSGKFVSRWDNQTNSGQNKLPPSADRWKARSKTYPGIARAMAEQWTEHLTGQLQLS
jgi:hypothetical protein